MGVLSFYKKFLIDIVKNKYEHAYETSEIRNPMSLLLDVTGIFYDIASDIYGIGDKLNGTSKDFRREEEIDSIKLKSKEVLKTEFVFKLKEILTLNIIEKIAPTDILIIGMDGKAFRAKQKQQSSRRFDSSDNSFFNASANFTFGTEMIKLCTETIENWIIEKRNQLPSFIYFSDCAEEGEAEHKIFRIFKEAIKTINNKFESE